VKIFAVPHVSWEKKLKVPVYAFLKEAIIRKYGSEFYYTLETTAKHQIKDKV